MKKSFLINVGILLGLNLVIKPVYVFGLERAVHDRLGNTSFELYLSLFSIAVIFQIINDLGIQSYTAKKVSADGGQIKDLFTNLLAFKLVLGLVYFSILTLAAFFIGYEFTAWKLLVGLGFVQFLSGGLQFLRANLAGLGYYKTDSLLSAVDRSLLIIILSVFLFSSWLTEFDLGWFIRAQIISMSGSVVIGFLLLRPHLGRLNYQINLSLFRDQIKESLPYALAVLMMAFYSRLDQVMLERMLKGSGEGGVYGMSYRLLDVLNMVGFLFAGLLLPMFSRMHAQGNPVKGLLQLSGKILLGISITLAVTVSLVAFPLLDLMYPSLNVTEAQAAVTPYLMGSLVMMSGGYIFGTYLVASDRLKQLNRVFLISLMLNVSLNLMWIPERGALGAAQATLITQSLVFLVEFIWVSRLKLVDHKELTFRILGLVGVMLVYVLWGQRYFPVKGLLPAALVCLLIGGLAALILGLFPIKELIQVLKEKESE